ncbi:NFACT RNA binding domain-containing protein [Rhodoflexus caldus]|uniref:NFACT RNA binding domain-containing protein n=1 Tax=Rhodoflexus caldus TaxID=2891236 RepID=UPI00202ABB9D|nr:NFACT RNA binding domain-containing protein [Rhodoflexus caldus]
MHNNYYILRLLTSLLAEKLAGLSLLTCFSQLKDELILGFADEHRQFYIRANLNPEACYLSFPEEVSRARQNSIELFRPVLGAQVVDVRQYLNERCFSVHFNNGSALLFKMHGQRSNLILFEPDEAGNLIPEELFHNKQEKDRLLRLETLDRPIDQSREAFFANGLQATFPTFDRQMAALIAEAGESRETQWEAVQELLDYLQAPEFYVAAEGSRASFSVFPSENDTYRGTDLIEALNEYHYTFSRIYYFEHEKAEAIRQLEKQKHKTERFIRQAEDKLIELELENRYEEIANILMANLHEIPQRASSVQLFDFYRNTYTEIKLKETLNAQKNAEVYYRKSKNHKIEIEKQREAIAAKQKELQKINRRIEEIGKQQRLKDLRRYLKTEGLAGKTAEVPELPFRRMEIDGFEVWIGKNARSNDLLTQKYAYKEDLWLHARDVSGSHVVIKYKAGKPFPPQVIEKAAQLAAWHSKRRHETLCPVIYTPKKYVRKPKGMPEGAVVVDREQVIMVEPAAEV